MFHTLQGCILSAMPQEFLNYRQDTSRLIITWCISGLEEETKNQPKTMGLKLKTKKT